jgi:hypothetical protein
MFIANLPGLNVLRLFRIGRVFRLVSKAKNLQRLFQTLVDSVPALGNIAFFIFAIFFIYTILCVNFFGGVANADGGLDRHANFRTFGPGLLTLYRISTGDGWEGPPNGAAIGFPDTLCDPASDALPGTECGSRIWSIIIFLSFMVIGSLVMVNLFIAVILENFSRGEDDALFSAINDFKDIWARYDLTASQVLLPGEVISAMVLLPPPLGLKPEEKMSSGGKKVQAQVKPVDVLKRLKELGVSIFLTKAPKKCLSAKRFTAAKATRDAITKDLVNTHADGKDAEVLQQQQLAKMWAERLEPPLHSVTDKVLALTPDDDGEQTLQGGDSRSSLAVSSKPQWVVLLRPSIVSLVKSGSDNSNDVDLGTAFADFSAVTMEQVTENLSVVDEKHNSQNNVDSAPRMLIPYTRERMTLEMADLELLPEITARKEDKDPEAALAAANAYAKEHVEVRFLFEWYAAHIIQRRWRQSMCSVNGDAKALTIRYANQKQRESELMMRKRSTLVGTVNKMGSTYPKMEQIQESSSEPVAQETKMEEIAPHAVAVAAEEGGDAKHPTAMMEDEITPAEAASGELPQGEEEEVAPDANLTPSSLPSVVSTHHVE